VVEQGLGLLAAEQLGGVVEDDVVEVGGHHGAGIHHGVAERVRLLAHRGVDPYRGQTKGGVGGLAPGERPRHAARVDGEELAGIGLAAADLDALEREPVAVGLELEVVADVHRRGQEADFLGELLAQPADALEQLAVLALVDHRDEAVADLEPEHIDLRDVVPARLQVVGGGHRRLCGGLGRGGGRGLLDDALAPHPGHAAECAASSRKTRLGMPGNQAEHADDRRGQAITCGLEKSWPMTSPPTSPSSPTRDTTRPAATETISEGICATRPSPMVSRV
jgi:hypothetical protein